MEILLEHLAPSYLVVLQATANMNQRLLIEVIHFEAFLNLLCYKSFKESCERHSSFGFSQ